MALKPGRKKIITGMVGLIILGAVSANAVMYMQQPAMFFFPLNEISQTPDQWGLDYEDITLTSSHGNKIRGWYLPVKGSENALLFFHGNGGNISHRGESLAIFHRLGFNTLIIDYQGYGKSEGSAGESAMYDDAEAGWDYLLNVKKFRDNKIALFGRSLGSAIAARLAESVKPRALILESTFSSVSDMARIYLPAASRFFYIRYRFNTLDSIKKIKIPLLVLHSRDDEIIPFELGEKTYRAANKPKIFIELAGDHNSGFLQSQPGYEQALAKFFEIY